MSQTILIAGGGIGGLCAALALADQGYSIQILEKAASFEEIGAGIQLGPNATRILYRLGLKQKLQGKIFQPDTIKIIDGVTGKTLNAIPLVPHAEDLFGSPYHTIHRADLHSALLEKAGSMEQVQLTADFDVQSFEEKKDSVNIHSSSGKTIEGDALIGADGIWSNIREQMFPEKAPAFSGRTAWRCLIPIDDIPDHIDRTSVHLYMGPGCHLVHYPVQQGRQMNVVAIIGDDYKGKSWDAYGNTKTLTDAFGNWHQSIKGFLCDVPVWMKWSLFEMAPLPYWTTKNVALLGDAAHPVLPFLAQGAAMAIEDAQCLAMSLGSGKHGFSEAFAVYQEERQSRVRRLQETSKRLGQIYHMTGLIGFARNLTISRRQSIGLLKDYKWLYGQ